MNFYLSSFRVGDRSEELLRMAAGGPLGFVPNALDFVDEGARAASNQRGIEEVRALGIDIEMLDLADYFGDPDALSPKLGALRGVWVRGGNTFVLRQAMRLSGCDRLVHDLPDDFLYAGYSAGACVLAPDLRGLQQVDDSTVRPYPGQDTVWEGLGLLDYLVLPHYQSDHPESADIDKEVAYCRANGVPFRTLRDGDVIVIDHA